MSISFPHIFTVIVDSFINSLFTVIVDYFIKNSSSWTTWKRLFSDNLTRATTSTWHFLGKVGFGEVLGLGVGGETMRTIGCSSRPSNAIVPL